MSLVGLGGLHGHKGLAKGKPSPVTDVTINAVAGSLLYESTAPTLTGIEANVNITGVAGALLYASSAPTVAVGGMTITDPGAYIWLTSDSSKSVTTTLSVADTTDGGSGTYDLSVVVTEGGTFTLSGTTGLTFSVGDGTADASMTFNGTIANINTALTNATFEGLVDEDATATVTFTRDSDSEFASSVINLLALPALPTTALAETTAVGTNLIPTITTALTGSSAVVSIGTSYLYDRPTISGLTLTNNANGTLDIDYSIDDFGTGTAAGTQVSVYYVISTSGTFPTGSTAQSASSDYVVAGNDLNGTDTNVVEDNALSPLVKTGTGAQTTITSGTLSNALHYVYLVAVSDAVDADSDALHSIVYTDSVTVTGTPGSGPQASGWIWMGQVF